MVHCTSHFYSFFSVNGLARVDFWHDNLGLCLASPAQAKNVPFYFLPHDYFMQTASVRFRRKCCICSEVLTSKRRLQIKAGIMNTGSSLKKIKESTKVAF